MMTSVSDGPAGRRGTVLDTAMTPASDPALPRRIVAGSASRRAPSPDPEKVAALLAENVNDYMSFGFFAYLVGVTTPRPGDSHRSQSLVYLEHMLRARYIRVGTLYDSTFVPWISATAQMRERFAQYWPEGNPFDYESLRDAGWLSNTSAGSNLASVYLTNRQ